MSNYDNNIMDWDSPIESDGAQFLILPEGDYTFTVTGFERGHYPGSAKIPACNKASLTLTVELPEGGSATCKEDLILYRTLEWKLASFFRAIGQKKHGERVVMDWSKVLGSRGRARFKPRSYTSGGNEYTVNAVDRYYDYDPQAVTTDWVRTAEQHVAAGQVQEVAPRQMSWSGGGF